MTYGEKYHIINRHENFALKLNVATLVEWRELQWSMSWLDQAVSFKIFILNKALIPGVSCDFGIFK